MLNKIRAGRSSGVLASRTPHLIRQLQTPEPALQLYGWDSRSRTWHGPSELDLSSARAQHLSAALENALGPSWFGAVTCSAPGELANRFFVVVHDLGDCALAMIYCEKTKAGPLEIVAAIPSERRARLRPDFAFEFLAYAGFLGSVGSGAELEVSEGITAALQETSPSDSLVFSISTGLWSSDLDYVLSLCVEQTMSAVMRWCRLRSLPAQAGTLPMV